MFCQKSVCTDLIVCLILPLFSLCNRILCYKKLLGPRGDEEQTLLRLPLLDFQQAQEAWLTCGSNHMAAPIYEYLRDQSVGFVAGRNQPAAEHVNLLILSFLVAKDPHWLAETVYG